MEASRVFQVDTKKACFLCFRRIQGKPEDKTNKDTLKNLKFLSVLQFLKVDFTTVDNLFQFLEGVHNKDKEFNVPLCHVCYSEASKFVGLVDQLKSIQTRISNSATKLNSLMKNQEITENYGKYLYKINRQNPGDLLNEKIFFTLRKETSEKLRAPLVAENIQTLMFTTGVNQSIKNDTMTPPLALTYATSTPSDSSELQNSRNEPIPTTSMNTLTIPSIANEKLKTGKRPADGELKNQASKKQKISVTGSSAENMENSGIEYENISPPRSPESVRNLLMDLESPPNESGEI